MAVTTTRLIVVLLLLTLFVGCEARSSDGSSTLQVRSVNERVLNGIPVEPGDVPQVVAVHSNTEEGPTLCTGIVLDSQHVLTAAHCVLSGSPITISSIAGDFVARGVSVHPGYFENLEVLAIFNDVAIIEFDSLPLPGLPLIVSQVVPDEPFMTTVYGFGFDNAGDYGSLQGGVVSIAQVSINHMIGVPFSGKEASPCNGDSGAPLIYTVAQASNSITGIVGLVSTGSTADCSRNDITFYTNLQNPAILSFIKAEVPGVSLQ